MNTGPYAKVLADELDRLAGELVDLSAELDAAAARKLRALVSDSVARAAANLAAVADTAEDDRRTDAG